MAEVECQYMAPRILIILGPTASGKSGLAVRLAREAPRVRGRSGRLEIGAEVISADSRQVYRGLDIGTGKITRREMRGVPHHLLDVADPRRRFTAERYRILARRAIVDILRRGKVPIICGGTGFYIDAALNESPFPNVPPNRALRKRLEKRPLKELLARLKRLDPNRWKDIDANPSDKENARRIVRAIEIAAHVSKRGWSTNAVRPVVTTSQKRGTPPSIAEYSTRYIGIKMPMDILRQRIRARLEKRLRSGMIAEVRRLHEPRLAANPTGGLSWKRMDELGLEYRYVSRYLRSRMTKKEMVDKLAIEIGRYAKRQMTWFRRNPSIRWLTPQKLDKAHLL